MVTGVIAAYKANGVPCDEPKDVAATFLHSLSTDATAEAFYVSAGKTYESETRLDEVKPQWLGQPLFDELMAGQNALGAVSTANSFYFFMLTVTREATGRNERVGNRPTTRIFQPAIIRADLFIQKKRKRSTMVTPQQTDYCKLE